LSAGANDFRGTKRFEVVRLLGEGGMGLVYEVLDRERGLRVALKTLRQLTGDALYRFKNEFRALQDLQHPNLVTLGELIQEEGRWFFTMELVEGVDFVTWVRPNAPPVAQDGPTRGALLDSLRMFSAALTVIEAAALHDNLSAQFELVVVKAPIGAKMKQAAELVGPGGYLYVEVLRRWGRSPADYISAIRQLRFVEVEAYWHWPNFGACTEIVPLGDPVAITHALGQHRSGGAERLKSALGRALVRMGLLARLVPCFSLVARKQARSESK